MDSLVQIFQQTLEIYGPLFSLVPRLGGGAIYFVTHPDSTARVHKRLIIAQNIQSWKNDLDCPLPAYKKATYKSEGLHDLNATSISRVRTC